MPTEVNVNGLRDIAVLGGDIDPFIEAALSRPPSGPSGDDGIGPAQS